jgi:uncharacterized alkaline shock family protein YloU
MAKKGNDDNAQDKKQDEKLEKVQNFETDEREDISATDENAVQISDEAIAMYAGIAISKVRGIYDKAGGFKEVFKSKKNLTKGIRVENNGKSVKLDVNIIVEYGARIPDVAFEIQTLVKKSIESMTGLIVDEVNVHIQGVHALSQKERLEMEKNGEQSLDEEYDEDEE